MRPASPSPHRAAERARAGEGPTFIEAITYRRLGHSSSDDPTRYRDPGEVEAWERRDPVERFRRHLSLKGLWDDAAEDRLKTEITAEVNDAIRAAEQAGQPAPETLVADVYADVPAALQDHFKEATAP